MTVDMLAAAFIWPEEMLLGRTHIGDDLVSDALEPHASDDTPPATETGSEPDVPPIFWAALMRRFRADPLSPGAEAR